MEKKKVTTRRVNMKRGHKKENKLRRKSEEKKERGQSFF